MCSVNWRDAMHNRNSRYTHYDSGLRYMTFSGNDKEAVLGDRCYIQQYNIHTKQKYKKELYTITKINKIIFIVEDKYCKFKIRKNGVAIFDRRN